MTSSTPPLRIGHETSATLRLAIPLAAAALAQMGMGLTDTILLGSLGRDALAAGGLGASLFFTITAVMQGLMTGVSVLVAHARGAKKIERIAPIFRAGTVLALFATVPVMLVLWWLEPILLLIGEPAALARDVGAYERILLLGAPASMLLATQRTYLAAINRPQLVMAVAVGALALNGVLNYGLIHGAWGLPDMGYLGSATASAIAIWIMLGITALIVRVRPALRTRLFNGPVDWKIVRELAQIGWPVAGTLGVELMLFAAGALMMGILGNAALAAHQVAINIAATTFMVAFAVGQAVNVRVGFHLGAGDPAAARRAGLVAFALGVGFMVLPAIAFFVIPQPIALLFNLDPAKPADAEAIALIVQLLAVAAVFQVFDGAQAIGAGALRGYKDTRIPMLLAAFSYWAVGFPVAWTLAFALKLGPLGVWWGLALGLMTATVLLGWRFRRLSQAFIVGARSQSISGA
jgi:MATE family multidrug resistance protein